MFPDEELPIIPNLNRFEIVGVQERDERFDTTLPAAYLNIMLLKDKQTGVLYVKSLHGTLTVLVDKDGKPCTELDLDFTNN